MFKQQEFSKQVVALASFGNRRQKLVTLDRGIDQDVNIPVGVVLVGYGQISTHKARTTNGRQQQNQRTRLWRASVAQQPAMLAVTSVITQYFMLMVMDLMSHSKFFYPDSVSGSECCPVSKSAVHPRQSVNAENIKRSSSGMPTLKRIGIVYGTIV
ncbi:MAG: hypothetical protein EZS28_009821 [Streblomastix strix]|uniref:Uncharacterized protein n=1 Tax=Streblomastix strix TaxID=222440 RepID=A0A5J4WHX0_9EUKA|nr:MAG: hypothetical protein EZS28_009821 [Streblomastix strix]